MMYIPPSYVKQKQTPRTFTLSTVIGWTPDSPSFVDASIEHVTESRAWHAGGQKALHTTAVDVKIDGQ